jgi:hypothetical protein
MGSRALGGEQQVDHGETRTGIDVKVRLTKSAPAKQVSFLRDIKAEGSVSGDNIAL